MGNVSLEQWVGGGILSLANGRDALNHLDRKENESMEKIQGNCLVVLPTELVSSVSVGLDCRRV